MGGLTAAAAQRRGIRVNALAPGVFMSEMSKMTEQLLASDVGRDKVISRTAMGRSATRGLVEPLLVLAWDAGLFVPGVTLAVDGGPGALPLSSSNVKR